MRLSNVKTRKETGLDHVMQSINVMTPFGKNRMKEIVPFMPGDEELLNDEFRKLSELFDLAAEKPETVELLIETFMDMKDIRFTIERSRNNALSVVELFEIKSLLLKMKRVIELLETAGHQLSEEFILVDTVELLDILDPRRDRMNTFYIYDDFSEKLAGFRKRKRELELSVRREQKAIKQQIDTRYGITLTPKFDYCVSKSNKELVRIIKEIPELTLGDEDYLSVTFVLKNTDEIDEVVREMDQLNEKIEEEELRIQEELSKEVYRFSTILLKNCDKIGELDFTLSKAIYARKIGRAHV